MHRTLRHLTGWSGLLAWILWSKLSVIGGAGGWQQPVITWEIASSTTTEGQCRDLGARAAATAQGTVTIPGGRMETRGDGSIARHTYECLPDTIDPRR